YFDGSQDLVSSVALGLSVLRARGDHIVVRNGEAMAAAEVAGDLLDQFFQQRDRLSVLAIRVVLFAAEAQKAAVVRVVRQAAVEQRDRLRPLALGDHRLGPG